RGPDPGSLRSRALALVGASNQRKRRIGIDALHELAFLIAAWLMSDRFSKGEADRCRLLTTQDPSSGKALWLAGFVSKSNAISINYLLPLLFSPAPAITTHPPLCPPVPPTPSQ